MSRKGLIMVVLLSAWLGSLPAFGADDAAKPTLTVAVDTGDVEFNAALGDLNITVAGNLAGFIADLSATYQVSQTSVETLLVKENMTPADAYLTLGIVSLTQQPMQTVVDTYKANKGKGWGVIAKRLGIKPGSKEFQALKNGGLVELEKAKGKNKKADGKPEGKKAEGKKAENKKAEGEKPEKDKEKKPKKK